MVTQWTEAHNPVQNRMEEVPDTRTVACYDPLVFEAYFGKINKSGRVTSHVAEMGLSYKVIHDPSKGVEPTKKEEERPTNKPANPYKK